MTAWRPSGCGCFGIAVSGTVAEEVAATLCEQRVGPEVPLGVQCRVGG